MPSSSGRGRWPGKSGQFVFAGTFSSGCAVSTALTTTRGKGKALRKPRIKRTTEEIETPEGDIYLLRPSAENDIRIEKPDAEEKRLLAAVNGERTLEQLQAEFGTEEVDDLIRQLQELEVVEDAADDERIESAELE